MQAARIIHFSAFAVAVLVPQCRRQTHPEPASREMSNGTRPAITLTSASSLSKTETTANALEETTSRGSLKYEIPFGESRVRFHISGSPPRSGKRPAFLLALHGLGGDGDQIAQALHLRELAEKEHVLYAAPDGDVDQSGRRFWDAGLCCNFTHQGRDDAARLDALIGHAVGALGADPQRVFVVGYSNGGMMAHRMACRSSHELRGVVSIAAFGPARPADCPSTRAVAVLEIHGDQDTVVPFAGGRLFGKPSMPNTLGVLSGLKNWARRNGCVGEMHSIEELDLVSDLPGAETQVSGFRSCTKAPIMLWKVRGGGHSLGFGADSWRYIWGFLDHSDPMHVPASGAVKRPVHEL
ncbi:MAG TPA: PHB depolymerase family esterase [Polyangiaceae bacterium]|nr:PHB depolymerase family esterase [Polyangiaceae bacterium]